MFLTAQRGVAAAAEPMEPRVTATVERTAENFILAVVWFFCFLNEERREC